MLSISSFIVAATMSGLAAQASAPPPRIENGRVVTRSSGTIETVVKGASTSDEPAWVAWRVPMIDGQGAICSTWVDDGEVVRGEVLDARAGTEGRPRLSPQAGPAQLEAGTRLVVMARVVNGRVERLRSISDDCPIDANGRTVDWLETIGTAESVRYLAALAEPSTLTADTRRVAQSAMTALAWHKDPVVTSRLIAWLASADTGLRMTAARALAAYRGTAGANAVITLLGTESEPDLRQQLVQALGRSSDPAALSALLRLARTDTASAVRGDAITSYTRLAGPGQIAQVIEIATADASPDVQRRALNAIGRLPQHAGVPALLTLARSSSSAPTLRREAVRALSASDDPRAQVYLQELLKE